MRFCPAMVEISPKLPIGQPNGNNGCAFSFDSEPLSKNAEESRGVGEFLGPSPLRQVASTNKQVGLKPLVLSQQANVGPGVYQLFRAKLMILAKLQVGDV